MTDKPETQREVSPSDADFWLCEIAAAKDRMCDWYAKAEDAEDRYRDSKARPFGMLNIFWANVETQKAAIGEDFGKPEVTRVNQPQDDGGLSRHIANIWQRAIAASVKDTSDNHDIGLAVHDMFVPGRGQVWLELEVEENEEGKTKWVKAPLVRVPYKDYLEGPATRWGSIPWVARAHNFTRDELVSICKLSEAEAAKVKLNVSLPFPNRKDQPNEAKGKEQFKRARVWEIWTKYPEKARIYVAEGYKDKILCNDPDPYRLKPFFPCPRPLLANGEEGWQEPLTDYSRYEDQAKELDEISARIFVLTAVLRRRGVYDKQFKELADLALASDNVLIAVENWAELQAKGGMVGAVLWEDLQPTIVVLAELHKQRRELIELIYELSGISDLARGQTDPRETLGAQKLKKSFGAGRFRAREVESRRFASESYQLKGELVAEMFPREQLAEMSGIPIPTQKEIDEAKAVLAQLQQVQQEFQQAQQAAQQTGTPPPQPPQIDEKHVKAAQRIANAPFSWEEISRVLHSDYRRCYSVEVETDQSKFIDEEADKKARIELLNVVNQLMQQFGPMIAGNPANGEVFKEIMMFVISAFKSGRSVEEGLERAIDGAVKQAMQQAQQGPQKDPKAEADVKVAEARVKTAEIGLQTAQVNLQRAQIEGQNKGADIQTKAVETQLKGVESQQKVQATHDQNQAKREGQMIDNVNRVEQLQFERAQRATAQEAILAGPTKKPGEAA